MLNRDLKTYVELGRALWADTERSRPATIDTLSAVSLLDLPDESALERASAVLLEQAISQGAAAHTRMSLEAGSFGVVFFRLTPAERFVLVGLHQGRWSYARLARVMRMQPEDIETLAWRARTALASDLGITALGAKVGSASCPEYDLDRPWAQRFLDEEIATGRERLFLQNHLMVCEGCRQSLNRCRDLYYAVEKALPSSANTSVDEKLVLDLQKLRRRGVALRANASQVTIRDGLIALLRQRDFQVFLGLSFAAMLWYLIKR